MEERKSVPNMELWNKVQKTDPKHTKKVTIGGRSFTTIDAQYQVRLATEQWGSYGATWGVRDPRYDFIKDNINDREVVVVVVLFGVFYYPGGMFQMATDINFRDGKGRINRDFTKKLLTDFTTKALSKLGFSADVFLGKFDDNKYVEMIGAEIADQDPARVALIESIKKVLAARHSIPDDVKKEIQLGIEIASTAKLENTLAYIKGKA